MKNKATALALSNFKAMKKAEARYEKLFAQGLNITKQSNMAYTDLCFAKEAYKNAFHMLQRGGK